MFLAGMNRWLGLLCIIFFGGGLIAGLLFHGPDTYTSRPSVEAETQRSIVDIVKEGKASVVIVEGVYGGKHSRASGIIFHPKGYIITSGHAVKKASSIRVVLESGLSRDASLIYEHPKEDLAILKLEDGGSLDLRPVKFGDSDRVKVGELVIAIGNPLGEQLPGSVSVGVISGRDRSLEVRGKNMVLLQTDAAINAGNSGGPLLNDRGEVIGIITFHIPSDKAQGIGFAIPSNRAREMIHEFSLSYESSL